MLEIEPAFLLKCVEPFATEILAREFGPLSPGRFQVGPWLVQPSLCRLSRDGRSTKIRAKLMDLLVYLARRPGEVVSKQDLLNDVWGTEAVSESALTRSMTELRQALEDSVQDPQIIETISKRGYRLIAPVSSVFTDAPADANGGLEQSSALDMPSRLHRYRWWAAAAAALAIAAGTLTVAGTKIPAAPRTPAQRPWFEQVTTRSPRALRSYALAAALMPERNEEAKPHLLDALREDPEFPSAHILLAYALYNTNAQPAEYLAHAEMAFRFSAGVTPAERHFIAASLFSMRAQAETDKRTREKQEASSIPEFEATVRLQPDNLWAITNLAEAYASLGRRTDSARVFAHLADLQPASLTVQARTANVVLESSGAKAARPYFVRASRLLESEGSVIGDPSLRQFVEFFPAHEAGWKDAGATRRRHWSRQQ